LGHKIFAAKVRREKQGTNTTVRGGGNDVRAGSPRKDNAALSTSSGLCCRTRIEEILKDHIAEGSKADPTEAGYRDLQVKVSQRAPLTYVRAQAGTGRVVVEVLSGSREVD
jgi:hypothetical protein